MRVWTGFRRDGDRRARALPLILAVGLITELALLWGLTRPLWIGRNPHPIIDWEPLATMIGISPLGFVRFAAALASWFAAYALALVLSRRPLDRGARRVLVLLPALFALTLAPTLPGASKDMYHYIMEGRAWAVHGANPLTTAPDLLPEDPLYWILSSWESEPSRYGPLWAMAASLPARVAGDSLIGSVLVFKAIMLTAFGATAWLVYLTVRRTRPEWALPAYVFLAWNPLLIFESAANGHNDTLMLAFTALALYLAARRRWEAAFPALAAAALIKYVTGLLGPMLLVWAWRSSRSTRERWRIALGLSLGLALTVVTYAPFWDGLYTFHALWGAAGDALNSPGWLLREGLRRVGASDWAGRVWVSALLTAVFIVAYSVALRMAWRPGREAGVRGAIQAGFLALATYICTLAWWFWPWYVGWLVPIGALVVGGREARLSAVWSCAALAAYIPINYRVLFWGEAPDRHMPFFAVLTVFGVAAVAAVWLYARPQVSSALRWMRARARMEGPAPAADPDTPSATA
jgi:hypothetical protein